MDNYKNDTHDYTDTIDQALGLDEDSERAQSLAEERERDLDFETLAVASSMGMLGMEETNANLLQLELAQELMLQLDDDNGEHEFHIGD